MSIELIVPIGTGIAANSSPSLVGLSGALACDSSALGSLYLGNAGTWVNVTSVTSGVATSVSLTLTASGQTSITGTLYLTKTTVNSIPVCYFQFVCGNTLTITANSTWTQASAVSATYQPSANCYFIVPIIISSNVSTSNAYLEITTAGTVNLGISTIATVTIPNANGSYYV